jgi:hypothetical protein
LRSIKILVLILIHVNGNEQQDVFTDLAQFLIEQIQLDPVGWAKNESLNTALQDSIQRLHVDGLISSDQREIAARISIRVDIKELEKLRIARHIDVMAVRHLQFKFTSSQPLRVLFSGSIVHKYSTLAVLLLQVKLVELILTNVRPLKGLVSYYKIGLTSTTFPFVVQAELSSPSLLLFVVQAELSSPSLLLGVSPHSSYRRYIAG